MIKVTTEHLSHLQLHAQAANDIADLMIDNEEWDADLIMHIANTLEEAGLMTACVDCTMPRSPWRVCAICRKIEEDGPSQ